MGTLIVCDICGKPMKRNKSPKYLQYRFAPRFRKCIGGYGTDIFWNDLTIHESCYDAMCEYVKSMKRGDANANST